MKIPENIHLLQPEYPDTSSKMSGKMSGKTSGKILSLMAANKFITIPELAASIGITERSIERNIRKLQENKLLLREGPAKGGFWKIL